MGEPVAQRVLRAAGDDVVALALLAQNDAWPVSGVPVAQPANFLWLIAVAVVLWRLSATTAATAPRSTDRR